MIGTHLSVWAAACWGLAGGACVEALWLHAHIRRAARWSWRKPIRQGLAAYLISVILRVGVGAAVAAAAAGSGQASGTVAAFALGVAAPLVVQKLARGIPLTDQPEATVPAVAQPENPTEAIRTTTMEMTRLNPVTAEEVTDAG